MSQSQLSEPTDKHAAAWHTLETKFAAFFHASPVALHVARIDTGTILDCNDSAAQLTGFHREEMIGRTMAELCAASEELRTSSLAAQPGERGRDMLVTIMCKSGQRKRCLVSGAEVIVDGQRCLLMSTVDISTREQADREHAFLSALVESSFDAIISRDMNGIVTGWNAAAEKTMGYSAEEAIGKHISFFVPPAAMAQFEESYTRLARGMAATSSETQRVAKDGRLVDLANSSFPVRNERGEQIGVATISRDISEQKRIEAALRASEERYRFLTESMKDVVWACDVETLHFTYVSPSITGLLGWTREEFLAAPVLTHFTGKSAQRAMHTIMQGLKEFSAGAGSGEQPPERRYYSEELEGLHKDGSIVWLEVIAFLYRNESSGRLEMHGVSRDIGERKRAEAALRASERRLQLAAHAAGLGVWHWRMADDYLEWDERMCEMYAVPESERTARLYYATWRSRLHPEDRERAERTAMEALRTASEWDCTFRIVLPDGAIRHIHGAAVIEYDDAGAPLRMIGINQDISQQKVYEQMLEEANAKLEREVSARTADLRATVNELQRANAGKDAFLTAISHELRTPLMGVLGMAELLGAETRGPLNSGQARYVAAITESGRRLLDIVNNLLMYTHLMSGRTTLVRTPCDLADLCSAAVHATKPQAERKRHRITQRVQPASLAIESDPDRIVNLLKLLLDNAVKFTPDGGQITVEISAGPADDTVQIVVTDTGIGMTPEEVVGLFRPFVQADGSLARRFEGMGIGLAIVYKMVELLGGIIGVESESGQGSRFIVTLPQGNA